jgi:hypothetical protein
MGRTVVAEVRSGHGFEAGRYAQRFENALIANARIVAVSDNQSVTVGE